MASSSVTVTLGDGVVTIHRDSSITVANILGVQADATGTPEKVWLDRLVHSCVEHQFNGWEVSGAVVSVLSKQT